MSTIDLGELPDDSILKGQPIEKAVQELIDKVAMLQKQIEFQLGGNIDSNNAREFGGFNIENERIVADTGMVGLVSTTTTGNDVRIWAGNTTPEAAPFRVYEDGTVIASSLTVTSPDVVIGPGTTFAGGYDPSTKETPAGAQAKADAAQAAASAAIDAAADAAAIEAKAYADGIVDAEEARAIADANTKLAAAQAYAITKANEAQAAAATDATTKMNSAKADAATAQAAADTANAALTTIANDNKLSPSEKQAIKKEWDMIGGEKPLIEAQGTTYGITSEKTAYTSAYTALSTYITPLIADLTTTSDITGTVFRTNFKSYYDARTTLLKVVVERAKTLADAAQAAADTATSNAASAVTTANAASSAASAAVTAANAANSLLADIANDNKLTSVEKQATKQEWDIVGSEKTIIEAQATSYTITTEKTAYTSAYTALSTYITPLLADLTATSDIVGTTFRSAFKTYYDARTDLLKAVSDKAKALADAAQATANNGVQVGQNYNFVQINSTDGLKVTNNDGTFTKVNGNGVEIHGGKLTVFDAQDRVVFDGNSVNLMEAAGWGVVSGLTFTPMLRTGNIGLRMTVLGDQTLSNNAVINVYTTLTTGPTAATGHFYVPGGFSNSSWNFTILSSSTIRVTGSGSIAVKGEIPLWVDAVGAVNKSAHSMTLDLAFKAGSAILRNGKQVSFPNDFTFTNVPVTVSFTDSDGWSVYVVWINSLGQIMVTPSNTNGLIISPDNLDRFPDHPRYQNIGSGTPDPAAVVLGMILWGANYQYAADTYYYAIMHPDLRDMRPVRVVTKLASNPKWPTQQEHAYFASSTADPGSGWNSYNFSTATSPRRLSTPIGEGKRACIMMLSNVTGPAGNVGDSDTAGAVLFLGVRDPFLATIQPSFSIGSGNVFTDGKNASGGYLVSANSLGFTSTYISDAFLEIGGDGQTYAVLVFVSTGSETRPMRWNWIAF